MKYISIAANTLLIAISSSYGCLPAFGESGKHSTQPFGFVTAIRPEGTAEWSHQEKTNQKLTVKLGNVFAVKLEDQKPISAEEAARIKYFIASLAQIDHPDFGISPMMSGHAFTPIAGAEEAGAMLLANPQLKPFESVRKLVELGPRALPFLLDALEDNTPTKLTIKHEIHFGGMWFSDEMWGNPLNVAEQNAISAMHKAYESHQNLKTYTVTIGDVCFMIVGQITGRDYEAARYQPTALIMLNSPTHHTAIAKAFRTIWASKDPAQHLLDSLLLDYATEGIFNGSSLDGWYEGSNLQIEAAMRLLYYFPRQSASMIAEHLRHLKVDGYEPGARSGHTPDDLNAWMRQVAANGVRADQFVKAVAWCQEPAIRDALLGIFQQTTDPDILVGALPGIGPEYNAIVRARLETFLNKLPATEMGPFGDGYHLLTALGQRFGEKAKPIFQRYMQNASLQRCRTMCHVFRETCGHWDIDLLAPLLIDKRAAEGWTYAVYPYKNEPRLPIRICDEAAETISMNHTNMPFQMEGNHDNLDRQIAAMRAQIQRSQRPH